MKPITTVTVGATTIELYPIPGAPRREPFGLVKLPSEVKTSELGRFKRTHGYWVVTAINETWALTKRSAARKAKKLTADFFKKPLEEQARILGEMLSKDIAELIDEARKRGSALCDDKPVCAGASWA